jgi:aspartyl protease family protein
MLHAVRNLLFVLIGVMAVIILFSDPFTIDRGRDGRARSAHVERGNAVPRAAVSRPVSQPSNQMTLRPGRGGHYFVTAEVGDADVEFLVDTGASLIALSYEDAERIGLDPDNLEYDGAVQTANGITRVAPITLDTVRVGQMEVDRVKAVVSKAPMGTSLLGMSFLRRLESYRVEDGNLVLYW